jgi:hypothetical protein
MNRKLVDKCGVAAGGTCAAHCAVTALLLGIQPLLGNAAAQFLPKLQQAEPWFVGVSLACAIVAIGLGVRCHRKPGPLVLGMIGFGLWGWALGILSHETIAGTLVSVGAGLCLASAHIWNLRCARNNILACC